MNWLKNETKNNKKKYIYKIKAKSKNVYYNGI